ncbi:MAG TPA: hypothetical protein PLU35_09005 [Phycisphaerales bacterium]|nr:hypothetical protein [Phycisphaerales bacterium]
MMAVVVAKTRMRNNICIGAVDVENGGSLRLVPRERPEYHSWPSFDARIGTVVALRGIRPARVLPPHVEDFLVAHWETASRIEDLPEWIRGRCDAWTGDRSCMFGGAIRFTPRGKAFVQRGDPLPSGSVGFWELPADMAIQDGPRPRYVMGGRSPIDVPYVGLGKPIPIIPAGTLVRVSLSRWWAPDDASMPESCWLQLSGFFDG